MVLATGMVQWIQLEKQVKLTELYLEGLTADPEKLITDPGGTGSAGARPSADVHNLVMFPKEWTPYLLEPHSPWKYQYLFKILMVTITSNLKSFF